MKKERKLENEIQNEICDYLNTMRGRTGNKILFWRSNNVPVFSKNNAGKMVYRSLPRYTPRGLPDIMVVVGGDYIAVEVKRDEDTKLSDSQKEFKDSVIMAGAKYIQTYSLEDFKNHFIKINI